VSTVVRPAIAADCEAMAQIYNHYIRETVVTFEEEDISGATMQERLQETLDTSLPWLVAEEAGEVAGFAYAHKWKVRAAYRFAVEITIYLDHRKTGRGIGPTLYGELFRILRSMPVHAVIGGIALPNEASVALHERMGLSKVAHFKEVGFKFGRWVDVAYWEMTL
jgi:phosphinothricin acetyltransferase